MQEGEIAMREVRVLQLAKHVNIVNLLEAYKSQSGRLYLVFGKWPGLGGIGDPLSCLCGGHQSRNRRCNNQLIRT
jgi:hypothetical protein